MVWGLAALAEGLLLLPLVVGLLEDWGVLKIAAALKSQKGKNVPGMSLRPVSVYMYSGSRQEKNKKSIKIIKIS